MERISRILAGRVARVLGRRGVRVVAVAGMRGCGKTTMLGELCGEREGAVYLDGRNPEDAAKLDAAGDFFLEHAGRLICVDGVERMPKLFSVVGDFLRNAEEGDGRGHADGGCFLLAGSVSPEWMRRRMEEAGLKAVCFGMGPLSEGEVGAARRNQLWMRGGLPASFLAPDDESAGKWLDACIDTVVERDLPQLGVRVPSAILMRFWRMCAHLHGELWNGARLADSLGVTGKTAVHYREVLGEAGMLRVLSPWVPEATRKRIVKAPRVYLSDTGLLHRLLGIRDFDALFGHPVRGASWKSHVIGQIATAAPDAGLFFYRTARGAGIDLLVRRGGRTVAVGMVAHSAPQIGEPFRAALADVEPDETWVAAPVREEYPVGDGIRVAPPALVCKALAEEASIDMKKSKSF